MTEDEKTDPDFDKKLHRYKTAYCPLHKQYVRILLVRKDENGEFLIDAVMADGTQMVFRKFELESYVL